MNPLLQAILQKILLPHSYVPTQNIPDIDLKVYNSVGQMVGINYTSGIYEMGIDGVNASGDIHGGTEWIAYLDNMNVYAVVDATPLKKWAEEVNVTLPENITVSMYMIQYDSNGTRTETKPVNITVSTENPVTIVQPATLLPPVISNVNISELTATSVVISWDTNKVADSLIKYGTSSGDYTLSESNTILTMNHSLKIENLTQDTKYYFTANSTDSQGNPNESIEYTFKTKILYNFSGFLQPINEDGTSVFKLGNTVPVKFQLRDSAGNYITDATASIYLTKITNGTIGKEISGTSSGNANKGNLFRYDSTANQYIINLNTKPLAAGTWRIRVELDDGTSKYVIVGLK